MVDSASRVVTLDEDESHHAIHVLRLGYGAEVIVFDGRGGEWPGVVTATTRRIVTVTLGDEAGAAAEPPVQVTLAIGLLKGDQMDAVIRDATMLGVAAIVPMWTAHVAVARRGHPAGSLSRWRRVAVASAKQCGRAVLPIILPITPFEDIVGRPEFHDKLICVEPAVQTIPANPPERRIPESVLLLVGPEGGWSDAEMDFARRQYARELYLGPRTLRAEVAPTVALSALWTLWGWA